MRPAVLLVLAACLALPTRAADPAPVADWGRLRKLVAADGKIEEADFVKASGWRTGHGFRWQLLVADADGKFGPAKLAERYKTDDKFRVRVEPLTDLHLYVLAQQSNGELVRLVPKTGAVKLAAGVSTDLPNESQWFDFRGSDGVCQLRLVAAPKALADGDEAALEKTLARVRADKELSAAEAAVAKRLVSLGGREVFPAGRANPAERVALADALAPTRPAARDAELMYIDPTVSWHLAAYLSPDRGADPVLVHDIQFKHAK